MDSVIPKWNRICLTNEYTLSFSLSFFLSSFVCVFVCSFYATCSCCVFQINQILFILLRERWKKLRICIFDLGHFIRIISFEMLSLTTVVILSLPLIEERQ